jgi:hypothetical protein
MVFLRIDLFMKPIEKSELYDHLSEFLKAKGIELKDGSYTKGIHAGCSLLADAINLSQTGIERAKLGLDKKLNQVRQVIHEKTAPKQAAKAPPTASAPPPKPKAAPGKSNRRATRKAPATKRKP